jgi:hypothetical protein
MHEKALRHNNAKARMDLLPWDAILELANHYTNSMRKYPDRNWEKGLEWNKGCAASMSRHLAKWSMGEDFETETLPDGTDFTTYHDLAMAWNAIALVAYRLRGIGVDDRPKKKAPSDEGLSSYDPFDYSWVTFVPKGY